MINKKTFFLLVMAAALFPELGFADSATTGLEWEEPLAAIRDSITGPIGYTIAVLAFAVAGIALVFGGEISDLIKRLLMLVMAVAFILFATNMVTSLFGVGETIPKHVLIE